MRQWGVHLVSWVLKLKQTPLIKSHWTNAGVQAGQMELSSQISKFCCNLICLSYVINISIFQPFFIKSHVYPFHHAKQYPILLSSRNQISQYYWISLHNKRYSSKDDRFLGDCAENIFVASRRINNFMQHDSQYSVLSHMQSSHPQFEMAHIEWGHCDID